MRGQPTQYDADVAEIGGVTARLGYRFNQISRSKAKVRWASMRMTLLNSTALGAPAPSACWRQGAQGFELLGRAGYHQIDIVGAPIDGAGFSYGAGVGWRLGSGFGCLVHTHRGRHRH